MVNTCSCCKVWGISGLGIVDGSACQLSDSACRQFSLFQQKFQAKFIVLVPAYIIWIWVDIPPLPGERLN